MRCDTKPHTCHWGLDWHARPRSLCLVNRAGEMLVHRQRQAAPEPFRNAMAPCRADRVVGGEGLCAWSGLADLCPPEGMPLGLGHALSMQAIPGGQATHETIAAPKMAGLRRGGRWPQASADPAAMRATRDLRRRRRPRMRRRAARLAPSQQTTRQDNLPELGTRSAATAHRDGVAERLAEPAVQQSLAVDRALIGPCDGRLTALERDRVKTATAHAAQTFCRRRSLPGVGHILALVLLDALHALRRVPRVQACVSSCRLVTCANESAGTRSGTAGKHIGQADLTWAFSDAAVLCRRRNPAGQQSLAR